MDNTAEIKAKWNAEHYDQMSVVVPKGSRDLIKQHANEQGMSISEYIRHLIAKDAPQCLTAGGGYKTINEAWNAAERLIAATEGSTRLHR